MVALRLGWAGQGTTSLDIKIIEEKENPTRLDDRGREGPLYIRILSPSGSTNTKQNGQGKGAKSTTQVMSEKWEGGSRAAPREKWRWEK
jgi:hypothetical protein